MDQNTEEINKYLAVVNERNALKTELKQLKDELNEAKEGNEAGPVKPAKALPSQKWSKNKKKKALDLIAKIKEAYQDNQEMPSMAKKTSDIGVE